MGTTVSTEDSRLTLPAPLAIGLKGTWGEREQTDAKTHLWFLEHEHRAL